MKPALASVLFLFSTACAVAANPSEISVFRGSFSGTASLAAGGDSAAGKASARFNASMRKERGTLRISTIVNGVRLPSVVKFNGRDVEYTLGAGATAAAGRGRVKTRNGLIRFTIPVEIFGSEDATVTARLQMKKGRLLVTETILTNDDSLRLSFRMKPSGVGSGNQGGDGGNTDGGGVVTTGNRALSFTEQLNGIASRVSIETVSANAFEKDGTRAKFRLTRTGNSLPPLTVQFITSGATDSRKSSASSSDYVLRDESGFSLANSAFFPQGISTIELSVIPTADGIPEVPETLALSLQTGPGYLVGSASTAAVIISDATQDPANDRIFLSYLVPVSGADTSASGVSTIRLMGDNSQALVSLSFNGLSSAQSFAHIIVQSSPGGSGPDVKGLPRGQVTDNPWTIAAAQHLATDQAMLNALFSGQIAITVATGNYSDGEIRGNYVLNNAGGSTNNPDIEPLTGEALERDVVRFLMQATFGPTREDVDALVDSVESKHAGDRIAAYSEWIDQQFALDQTRLLDYTRAADAQEWLLRGTDPINYVFGNEPSVHNRRRGWWLIAAHAHDQLRQRVAFALEQLFVVSDLEAQVRNRHYGAANYHDMLARNADGSYRALLGEVSRSPIMGSFLSSLKNSKAVVNAQTGEVIASPDENYAREVMQLFSIGLVLLNPDGSVKIGGTGGPTPTYTIDDITELARVFTGWSFAKVHGAKALGYPVLDNDDFYASTGPAYFQVSWLNPMKNFTAYHDFGEKTVLGVTIPAGLSADADMDAALDILANHPNTPPFIARRLIQRLVTSSPAPGYIARVAAVFENDGSGNRGNLKAVVRAILLDAEARNPAIALQPGHGKQKEPIIRYIQLLRALDGACKLPFADLAAFGLPASQLDNFPAGTCVYRYGDTDNYLGQTPMRAPSVFNWFLPDYSPPGPIAAAGLFAPEMQLTTETQVIEALNQFRRLTSSDGGQNTEALFAAADNSLDDVFIDRTPLLTLYQNRIAAGDTVTQAVTAVLDDADLLLTGGRLKELYEGTPEPNPRSAIIAGAVNFSDSTGLNRVKTILYLVTASPAYIHQP